MDDEGAAPQDEGHAVHGGRPAVRKAVVQPLQPWEPVVAPPPPRRSMGGHGLMVPERQLRPPLSVGQQRKLQTPLIYKQSPFINNCGIFRSMPIYKEPHL